MLNTEVQTPVIDSLRLAGVDAAIAVCTLDGVLLGATASACELFARGGVACQPLPSHLPPSLVSALCATPLGQSNEWRPQGTSLCLGWTRYQAEGGRALLLMREITERQRELSRRLHQQRLETIGTLVAGIAHDLRTPLASIAFAGSVLRSRGTELAEADRGCVHTILEAVERMRQELAGLLSFARLGPAARDTGTRVDEVVLRVASLVRPLLRERHHELHVALGECRSRVAGNPLVIEQVLANLIINAAESGPEGLHITVEVVPSGDRRYAAIDVIDDGPGVDASAARSIFEPFYTTKSTGTGLGLTISREATRELGGDVRLLPSGGGAHFRVTLPFEHDSGGEAG